MTSALSIRNLQKTYANGVQALKGIDLEVSSGDFFALLGPNGAGKSTTLGIICSLVRKTAGQVSIYGCDIDKDFKRARSYLGIAPQEVNFSQFEQVQEILIEQAGYYGIPRSKARVSSERCLKQLGLWEMRRTVARQLSGGMKRRLLVARALVHEPRLLILDEPTAGVDLELRRLLLDFLREINESGVTIILTTHYLEEAEALCRNIAIIDRGEIVQHASMKELLRLSNRQIFILDTRRELPADLTLRDCESSVEDERTLRVSIAKEHSLNAVFQQLAAQQVEVTSMRPERNRLESLFIALTKKHGMAESPAGTHV